MGPPKPERFSFCFPFPVPAKRNLSRSRSFFELKRDGGGWKEGTYVCRGAGVTTVRRHGLVGLIPRYRMVWFGSHLTQSERTGAPSDKWWRVQFFSHLGWQIGWSHWGDFTYCNKWKWQSMTFTSISDNLSDTFFTIILLTVISDTLFDFKRLNQDLFDWNKWDFNRFLNPDSSLTIRWTRVGWLGLLVLNSKCTRMGSYTLP